MVSISRINRLLSIHLSYFLMAVISLILISCGGGGGSSSSTATDAQGIYAGSSSAGYSLNFIILENGEFYNIFSSGGVAYGIDYGTGSGTNNAFNGSFTEFYIPTNSTFAATLAGTLSPKTSISGSTKYANGNAGTFAATYNPIYDTPATSAALTGTYTGIYYTGAPVTMVVSSTGAVTGTSNNCSFSGTATPRSTGKYVYDVTLNFSGSQCAPGNGLATGVGVLGTVSGSTYLYTAGLNTGKTNGFFWIGQKNSSSRNF